MSRSAKTFNLRDLSREMAEAFNLTHQKSTAVALFMFDRIKEEMIKGKQVRIHKFGTLLAKPRAAGVARNPVNGVRVDVPSRKVVRLKVSPALRKLVNAPKKAAQGV